MALSAGSIAFTGFNGDGNDNLSFVALTDIPQGTVINFTDSNWSGSSFASGSNAESTMSWTATSAIAAGTVIDINNIGSGTLGASVGTVTFTNANNTGLSNDSEVVYAYVGTAAAPTFLAAISNVGYSTADGTLTGTGLVAGQTAVSFTGGLDIVGYNGTRSGQTSFAAYLAAINNSANWQTQNGSGNQSADGTAPDAPFPTTAFTVTAPAAQSISFSPSSVSVAEGDSGIKILTFTVVRSGGTTGALSFSGAFAAGTTNAADYFGGTLPASTFSGSFADGATSATVTITISGDTAGEGDESFLLTLTGASNPSASVTIGTATATGTIINDDGTVLSSSSVTPITLANNDRLTILSGVTLAGTNPVTWVGGSTSPGASLDNFGTIAATGSGRALSTSGSTSGSLTVHNESGATITAIKDAVKISNLGASNSGTVTITNDGAISSTGTGSNAGQALDLDDINSSSANTVVNNAAGAVISAADADAIRPGANATINNYGQIVSHNASAASTGNDAIDFQSVNTGGVVNNFAGGIIDGARHGITGNQPITVNNSGTITGEAGSGINMDSASTTTTTVTNHGTITGNSVNGADADGIDVDGLVSIDNFGTIQALGFTSVANGLNEALAIGGGKVTNEGSGKIVSDQRAITVDDSNGGSAFGPTTIVNAGTIQGRNGEAISIASSYANSIANSGTITGSIALGDGNDTLVNSGTITGKVSMGAGDDTITLVSKYNGTTNTGTVTGTIDGGAGHDTLILSTGGGFFDGGNLDGNKVTDVQTLDVQAGRWGLSNTAGFSQITVESGASVSGNIVGATLLGFMDLGSGQTATNTTIGNGGSQRLLQGSSASGTTITGGYQNVLGGSATLTTINSGGVQSDNTIATNTTINNGGLQSVTVIGRASHTSVNGGGTQIVWGNADNTTIDGGDQFVYGKTTATTLNSGRQVIESGGSASSTIMHGGDQEVFGGGTASGTIMDGGSQNVLGGEVNLTTLGNGAIEFLHDSDSETTLNNGGDQNVYTDGMAAYTTINSGGVQFDWGKATYTAINGGDQYVFGTVTSATLSSGRQIIEVGGTANSTTINDSQQFVYGGTVSLTTIKGGEQDVYGGAVIFTTIHGGEQNVFGGGIASGTIMDGGTQNVYGAVSDTTVSNGAIQHLHGTAADTTVNSGGQQNIYADGTATDATLNDGGVQFDWGSANGTTINGGSQYVYGADDGTTIASGTQVVEAGGNADGTTVIGGDQIIHGGGTATGATLASGGDQLVYGTADQTTIGNGGLQHVHASATNTTVNSGGDQNVYTDGTATGTTLNSGGVQIDWGTAVGTTINGGNQYVWGTATATTISSGVQHVGAGGTASDTTIGSGGVEYVHSGGAAHDVTFGGPNATLALDQTAAFSGTISGWQQGDRIDLGDILFSDGSTTLAYSANAGNTGGTLTVSDGSHVASLELLGQYTAAAFALSSDGHGGTLINDPGVAAQNVLAPALAA